jgi:hypothetical protein
MFRCAQVKFRWIVACVGVLLAPAGSAAASGNDSDGDGSPDAVDNCIEVANPDQLDLDRDGFGNRCDPDLNNDGRINAADLGWFRKHWGEHGGVADLDGDGVVGESDLSIARASFLKAPGPSAHGVVAPIVVADAALAAPAATPVVTLQPASRTVSLGSFVWPLEGHSFGVVTEGGGVTVQFDPQKLRLDSVKVDTTVWEFGSSVINNSPGNVEIIFASFQGQTGDFPVAKLNLTALAGPGTSMDLEPSALNPFASGGATFAVTFVDGLLTVVNVVNSVPVAGSAAISMLALALCGLGAGFFARRRRGSLA